MKFAPLAFHKQANPLLDRVFVHVILMTRVKVAEVLRKNFLKTACPTRGRQMPVSLEY